MIKRVLFSLALFLAPSLALAQQYYPIAGNTGAGALKAPAAVMMCLDGSGNAVPATSAGVCLGGSAAAVTVADGADVTLGAKADAACGALPATCSLIALTKALINLVGAAIPAGTNLIGKVGIDQTTPGTTNLVAAGQVSQYPIGATAITASATGTTGATTATLAGTSGKTTYICGYSIRANATANTNVTNTITGVITATLSSIMWVPANTAGLGIDEQIFYPCIPASATNTGIAIVSGAPGTGGLVSSRGWGYQL